MTEYSHGYTRLHADGTTETIRMPWTVADFHQAMASIDAEMTPRRLREAHVTAEGRAWMQAKHAEIDALVAGMDKLLESQ